MDMSPSSAVSAGFAQRTTYGSDGVFGDRETFLAGVLRRLLGTIDGVAQEHYRAMGCMRLDIRQSQNDFLYVGHGAFFAAFSARL
jgi:hypothetical protein